MNQVESCYEKLRRMIVTGEFPPGVRLNEKKLIERLGYGRTPVREALLRLDHERLIETRQRSGYLVRPLTRKSINDFFVVWHEVVPLIVTLAMQNMNDDVRDDLINLLKGRGEAAQHDPFKSALLARQFFDRLVEVAGNEPLDYVYHRLGAELERLTIVLFSFPAGKSWANEDVSGFLRESDIDKAAAIVRGRVDAARRALLEYLDAKPLSEVFPSVPR